MKYIAAISLEILKKKTILFSSAKIIHLNLDITNLDIVNFMIIEQNPAHILMIY